jgi:hypothetical protein
MEKGLQDLVWVHPKSKVEIFFTIWLNLKIFFSILAMEYFLNFGLEVKFDLMLKSFQYFF